MINSLRYALFGLLTVCVCIACSRAEPVLTGATMGTTYSVIVPRLKQADQEELQSSIDAELLRINQSMSTYQDDSIISAFNASKSTDWFEVSKSFVLVTDAALKIAADTAGAFDPTIGPLVRRWGFGKDESVGVPADDEIARLLRQTGFEHLTVDLQNRSVKKSRADIQLDLNAIAKGYAVDQLAALVQSLGYDDFLVEIGGELRLSGENGSGNPWRIGIEAPASGDQSPPTGIQLSSGGVATSGDYRNAFEQDGRRYSHIIDARDGVPVSHNLASVTVVAESAMLADGWATALMVLGPDDGMKIAEKHQIACLFILREQEGAFTLKRSPAFEHIEDN